MQKGSKQNQRLLVVILVILLIIIWYLRSHAQVQPPAPPVSDTQIHNLPQNKVALPQ